MTAISNRLVALATRATRLHDKDTSFDPASKPFINIAIAPCLTVPDLAVRLRQGPVLRAASVLHCTLRSIVASALVI
jgi:hypothetical protein